MFKKGYTPWNKDKNQTEEFKRNISIKLKGRKKPPRSKEHSQKIGDANRGRKASDETRKKQSLSMTGKKKPPFTEEHIKNLSESHKGQHPTSEFKKGHKPSKETILKGVESRKGYRHSEETRKKQSLAQKGKKRNQKYLRGKDCHFWKDGKSFEIYPVDWTRSLKIAIRERDKYTCQLCGEKQEKDTYSVHHIDYDKKNCNPDNLTTLCRSCHIKTNFNRENWIEYFKNKFICLKK